MKKVTTLGSQMHHAKALVRGLNTVDDPWGGIRLCRGRRTGPTREGYGGGALLCAHGPGLVAYHVAVPWMCSGRLSRYWVRSFLPRRELQELCGGRAVARPPCSLPRLPL